jgi:hypothetical protein
VLRTQELEAVHRFDGAEQYFTRAIDFGFSFSVEETFDKWGREEIVGDYVRLIRTVRPDVIAALSPEGTGGGQHHQASALLSREAYHAAADPSKYPEQIKQGLRPWQAKKFYFNAGALGGGRGRPTPPSPENGFCLVDTSGFDALIGRTYAELGAEAPGIREISACGHDDSWTNAETGDFVVRRCRYEPEFARRICQGPATHATGRWDCSDNTSRTGSDWSSSNWSSRDDRPVAGERLVGSSDTQNPAEDYGTG